MDQAAIEEAVGQARRNARLVRDRAIVAPAGRSFTEANATVLSPGDEMGRTFQFGLDPIVNCADLRIPFGNYYWSGSFQEAPGPNIINVKASVLLTGPSVFAIVPVLFSGKRTVAIDPGMFADSDVVPVELAAGTRAFLRVYVSVNTLGDKWPVSNRVMGGSAAGDATSSTDTTDSSGLASASAYSGRPYGPAAIFAERTASPLATVMEVGDSIAHGYNDTPAYQGWIARAFDGTAGVLRVGTDGDSAEFFRPVNILQTRWRRLRYARHATHAIVGYGRNDLSNGTSLANIQTYLTEIWTMLALRGIKVHAATVTPRTSGGNTSKHSSEATRVALNDWIRTVPSPLSGVIDVADATETARNSGFWKNGYYAGDEIHPTSTAYAAMAAAVATSKFRVS